MSKKDTYQVLLYDFIKDVFVVCPNCSQKAIVKTDRYTSQDFDWDKVSIICTECGYNRKLNERTKSVSKSESNSLVVGISEDPFFNIPLWLKANVANNELWAYNYEHLEFLKQHIGSKLRERSNQENLNKSLGSRLPKWMTAKGNRKKVLKEIDKLLNKE